MLYAVIFMSLVAALAGLILFCRDKITLKRNMSPEERQAALAERENRLQRKWAWSLFVLALVALPVHALGLIEEPLWQRLLYFFLAALIVLSVVSGRRDSGDDRDQDEAD